MLKVFLGASGTERTRVQFRQGRLRQIKFFEGGEVRDQGVAIAEVANDHTGVQQNTFTRNRHQSDPLPPLRRAQSPPPPRQPCNPPWPPRRHGVGPAVREHKWQGMITFAFNVVR